MMKSALIWLNKFDEPNMNKGNTDLCSRALSPISSYKESFILVALFGILLYLMTRPAFNGFFLGEDFITRSLYLASGGNFLRAIFTPFGPFLRPSAVAWSIGTQLFIPWNPAVHHWRNFVFELLNVFLLHRIMLRVTDSFLSRVLGLAFFVVSKVQLTIIGYINCIDNIGTLFYFLTTILFLLRYFQGNKKSDYVISIVFFTLCALARDTGPFFIVVILAMFFFYIFENRAVSRAWKSAALEFLPYVVIVIGYLILREAIVGTLPMAKGSTYPAYAIRFDGKWILNGIVAFVGNLLNLSFLDTQITGFGDLSTLFTNNIVVNHAYKIGWLVFSSIILIGTFILGIMHRKWIAFSLVWAAILFLPTLLIGNNQIYYMYEPLAGVSLFLAMSLDHGVNWRKALITLWVPVIFITGVNGYAHSQNISMLAWRWVADQVLKINDEVFIPNRGLPIHSLTFLVSTEQQAAFTRYLIDPALNPPGAQLAMLKALINPEINEFNVFVSNSSNNLLHSSSTDLVYRLQDKTGSYIPLISSNQRGDCNSFEGNQNIIKPAWILNTQVSYDVSRDFNYVSDGDQSIQVAVSSQGKAANHFGGVELLLPPQNDFFIDLWIDQPQDVKRIYVYEMDNKGNPVYAWVNDNPVNMLVPEKKSTLVFIVNSGNEYGFYAEKYNNVETPQSLYFFLDVYEGKRVTYYLDQLCTIQK